MSMPPAPTPSLLGVLPEVRNNIYAHLFTDTVVEVNDSEVITGYGEDKPFTSTRMPAILETCRLVRSEAIPVFAKLADANFYGSTFGARFSIAVQRLP